MKRRKKMNKNKKSKNILLLVILLAVIGIAVGYAALSQNLFLNGTGTVASSSAWNVHFTKETSMSPLATVTDDGVYDQSIAINDSLLEGTFAATLEPGASIDYTVNIVNDGTIHAVVEDGNNAIVTPSAGNTEFIKCTVTPVNDITTELYQGSGNTHTYKVTLTCDDMETLPTETATATFKVDFNYIQKN